MEEERPLGAGWESDRLRGSDSLRPQARQVCITDLPSISPEACELQEGGNVVPAAAWGALGGNLLASH